LIHTLGTSLSRKIVKSDMSESTQIFINLEYFELACGEFEELLMEKRAFHKGKIHLHATKTFKDLRLTAEKRLYELVHSKINDSVASATYDW
jgi:exocyst complex component 6